MNKQAFMEQQTAVIIIMLVVSVTIFAAAGYFFIIAKDKNDIEVCRLSALAHSTAKVAGQSTVTAVPVVNLECKRRSVEFFSKKVEINENKAKQYPISKSLAEDTVNKVIANELESCWYKMGEGKLDIFKRSTYGDNDVCLICAEVSFDESVEEKSFSNLDFYLKKTSRSEDPEDTFYKYLTKSQSDKYGQIPDVKLPWTHYEVFGKIQTTGSGSTYDVEEDQVLEKSKRYIVYFLGYKPQFLREKLRLFNSAYYIGITESEKLGDRCNTLVN